ncbi:MAG: DNA gyrase inhibitor YacG [Nitrospirales bacterium]|nr:DNA gyrase inhibitor YacG [Nitrospirales bacterium]
MQVTCPTCRKKTTWEENPWRPFCSERCKMVDLGKWAAEEFKVPGEEIGKERDEGE